MPNHLFLDVKPDDAKKMLEDYFKFKFLTFSE
jgi:hypothetical protein